MGEMTNTLTHDENQCYDSSKEKQAKNTHHTNEKRLMVYRLLAHRTLSVLDEEGYLYTLQRISAKAKIPVPTVSNWKRDLINQITDMQFEAASNVEIAKQ